MRYRLKIFGSMAFVSSKRFTYAWISTPGLELCIPGKNGVGDARVTASSRGELSDFVRGLAANVDAIVRKQKKASANSRRQCVEWNVGRATLSLPVNSNAGRIIKRFGDLLHQIAPLVELAEVICQQIKRRPLITRASVRFYGRAHIDGTQQWLAEREAAAAKIDPKTAEIESFHVPVLDPYQIHSELPEECSCVGRQWFAASPESDGWVWFGDLPSSTSDALQKRIEKEQSRETKTTRKK